MQRGAETARVSRGFTLVEVMVALVVVALAIPALLVALNTLIDGTAYLRDRSLAQLVASNRLGELRLALDLGNRDLGNRVAGSEEMAGRTWYWSILSEATEVPDFSRIEVQVRTREDDTAPPLYTLVAFLKAGDPGTDTTSLLRMQRPREAIPGARGRR